MQVTFLPVGTSFLDVLSTRCPPGTSPSSSTFKPSPSALHHILVSLALGALMGVLPHFLSHRGCRNLPAPSCHLCTCSRLQCRSAPHWHIMPLGSCPQVQHPRDIPRPPMSPQHGFAIQPMVRNNPSPCSTCATASCGGLGLGKTRVLPTQLPLFPPCSRHRPQHGCQDSDRHRCGQPGRDGPVQLRGQPVRLVAALETPQPLG